MKIARIGTWFCAALFCSAIWGWVISRQMRFAFLAGAAVAGAWLFSYCFKQFKRIANGPL